MSRSVRPVLSLIVPLVFALAAWAPPARSQEPGTVVVSIYPVAPGKHLEFLRWLSGVNVSFVLIFTKTDKQSAAQSQANIELFKKAVQEFRAEMPDILVSSSKTRAGRTDILNYIEKTLAKHNRSTG